MLNLIQQTDCKKTELMNNISGIAMQYKISLFIMIISFLFVNPRAYATDVSDTDLEQRVENLSSAVDIRYTSAVRKHIRNYTIYNKKGTEVLLGRVSLYFPLFENVLREKGLPDDLKYLSIIESALKPTAKSKAGASGLWQFMKGTGKMMGLKVNSTIDERRDPVKSTEAAAEYLKYLYERFDDWTLALAAYNCGPGNVRKAIRKSGGKKTFWEISKYLPRETRNYIPKFIAVSYLMNYYYDHGLTPQTPEDYLVNTASAQVFDKILLRTISNSHNISLSIIKKLNPAYIRNVIPASADGRYQLTLPLDDMYNFVNNSQSATLMSNPYAKAVKVKVTPRALIAIAKLDHPSILDKEDGHILFSAHQASPALVRKSKYKSTKLKARESLADVARRVGVSLETLTEINGYNHKHKPTVGSRIKFVVQH